MKTYFRNALGLALIATAASITACNEFLAVENPGSLEAEAIDPERDARLLSQSAYQNFVTGIREVAIYVAWFTNHARVGDTFPTRNDFGRRSVPNTNTHISNDLWNPLHRGIQFARFTISKTEAAGNTVDLARAWFVSGFSILMQAELFCEGTIAESTLKPRGLMTTVALLDSAILDLQKVQTVAAGVTGSTEAANLSMAAQVGIARAHLQAGRKAQASAAAALVPATFVYSLIHIDNSTQRALGNQVWLYSESRISLVAGPEFRAMADAGDPRIAYVTEARLAQDGVLPFTRQNKYKGWADSERFASGLEAAYIKAEADQNAAAMLTFINTRRAVGAQTAMAATADMTVLMTELMMQKSRDFWLEGRGLGDFRRNPTTFPFIIPTGPNYYKPSLGPVASDICWPVPESELRNNCVILGKC